jgi:hypothetical protein
MNRGFANKRRRICNAKSNLQTNSIPKCEITDPERQLFVTLGQKFRVEELYVIQALCYYALTKSKMRILILAHTLPVVVTAHLFIALKFLDEEVKPGCLTAVRSFPQSSTMSLSEYCELEFSLLEALEWKL